MEFDDNEDDMLLEACKQADIDDGTDMNTTSTLTTNLSSVSTTSTAPPSSVTTTPSSLSSSTMTNLTTPLSSSTSFAKRLDVVYLTVGLSRNDVPNMDSFVTRTKRFAVHKEADVLIAQPNGPDVILVCMARQGVDLTTGKKRRITYHNGMAGVSAALGVPVFHWKFPKPMPLTMFRSVFPNGYCPDSVVCNVGTAFSHETVNAAFDSGSNRHAAMLNMSKKLEELAAEGHCDPWQIPSIAHARDLIVEERMKTDMDSLKVLDGPVVLAFRLYDRDGRPVQGGETYQVTIVGLPGDTSTKLKHWWIYSTEGNYGKTYTVEKDLEAVYRAHTIASIDNAMEVPTNTQLIIFDEYGPSNRLPLTKLRGLTGGNASKSSLNRKSYGRSFIPRPDAQIIILSNYSPYETYSVFDRAAGKRIITQTTRDTLEKRFNIVRLGGDDAEMKNEFVQMCELTPHEFNQYIRNTFYEHCRYMNSRGTLTTHVVKNGLEKCYRLYASRYPRGGYNMRAFKEDVKAVLHKRDEQAIEETFGAYSNSEDGFGYPKEEAALVRLVGEMTPYEVITRGVKRGADDDQDHPTHPPQSLPTGAPGTPTGKMMTPSTATLIGEEKTQSTATQSTTPRTEKARTPSTSQSAREATTPLTAMATRTITSTTTKAITSRSRCQRDLPVSPPELVAMLETRPGQIVMSDGRGNITRLRASDMTPIDDPAPAPTRPAPTQGVPPPHPPPPRALHVDPRPGTPTPLVIDEDEDPYSGGDSGYPDDKQMEAMAGCPDDEEMEAAMEAAERDHSSDGLWRDLANNSGRVSGWSRLRNVFGV